MTEHDSLPELLQTSPLGFVCLEVISQTVGRPDYRVLAVNTAFVRLSGWQAESIVGRRLSELATSEFADFQLLLLAVETDDGKIAFQHCFSASGCGCRVLSSRSGAQLNLWLLEICSNCEQQRLQRLLGEVVSKLKQVDQARQEYDLLYRAVAASLNEIYIFDADNLRFHFINRGALNNLGYTLEEAQQLTPLDLKPLVTREAFDELVEPLLRHEKPQQIFETVHQRKDGSLYPVLVYLQLHQRDERRYFMAIIQDITERKQTMDALRLSEQRFRDLFQRTPKIAVQGYDEQRRVVFWNQASEILYGYTAGEAEGRQLEDLIIPSEMRQPAIDAHRDWLERGIEIPAGELTLLRKDGSVVNVFSSHILRYDAEGRAEMYCIDIDMTEQLKARENLMLAASVFEHANEGIMITDPDTVILDVNAAFTRITGYLREEVLGATPRLLSSGRHDKAFYAEMWRTLGEQGHWVGEIWNRRKNGEAFAELLAISEVRDPGGDILRYVALFSDITALKQHQDQLEKIAHYDALTGLPNRSLLADRLQQAMAQTLRRNEQLAAVYLDLDGFKAVNDNHGHDTGDRLLTIIAERMKHALRDGDTLARLGGDEFVAVLLNLPDVEACRPLLERLLQAAAEPVEEGDTVLRVSASLGVSFYPQAEPIDADQLLRQADQAMYQAKQCGKNRYHLFDPEHDRNVRGRHESLAQIRLALERREFVLYYQPKVNMHSGQVMGVEALVRWQHPQRGLLSPATFLPVIENHPLMVELGDWVIDAALAQIVEWRGQGLILPVSVNVAAQQLEQSDFLGNLQAALACHPQLQAGDLELEVLETSALEDIAHISAIMESCRQFGVKFALDDFGTGYSSLTYLKRLPAQIIKIDQSFVRDMLDDPDDLAILEGVLGLAGAFRRQVVAEGVETVEHGQMLLKLGCELGQGYAIARPMPAEKIGHWLRDWQPTSVWTGATAINRNDLPVLFAMVDHRAWVTALIRYLQHDAPGLPPVVDVDQCRLGQWLNEAGRQRYAGHPQMEGVETIHQTIHGCAQRLITMKQLDAGSRCQSGIHEITRLRDELLASLHGLLG